MSAHNTCLLINTLRLVIVVAMWVIGALLGYWDMDLWTFIIFAFVYGYIAAECACDCAQEQEKADAETEE